MDFNIIGEVDEENNCLQTCLAIMLKRDISTIPNFPIKDSWREDMNKWLDDEYGMYVLEMTLEDDYRPFFRDHYIINNIVLDCGTRHAVIVKNDIIIYDPLVGEVNVNLEVKHDAVAYLFGKTFKDEGSNIDE